MENERIEKLIAKASRYGGRILVSFPYNDYYRGGRVKTCSPSVHLKPKTHQGKPVVQFNRALYSIEPEVSMIHGYEFITFNALEIVKDLIK